MKRALFIDISSPILASKLELSKFNLFLENFFHEIEKCHRVKFYLTLPFELHLSSKENFNSKLRGICARAYSEGRLQFVNKTNFMIDQNNNFLDPKSVEYNVMLSEHYIGSHFGDTKNFEGDDSIFIQSLNSFFIKDIFVSETMATVLANLGYQTIFSFSKSLMQNKHFTFVPLSLDLTSFIVNSVTVNTFQDFIIKSKSNDYDIYYLDLMDIFYKYNSGDFVFANLENLLYLIDKDTSISWFFYDELATNLITQDIDSLVYNPDNDVSFRTRTKISKIQSVISSYIEQPPVNSFVEEFASSPVWKETGVLEIDNINRFNLLLLVLLSSKFVEEEFYSDFERNNQINLMIKELSSLCPSKSKEQFVIEITKLSTIINQNLYN